jgi:hypothetical protein
MALLLRTLLAYLPLGRLEAPSNSVVAQSFEETQLQRFMTTATPTSTRPMAMMTPHDRSHHDIIGTIARVRHERPYGDLPMSSLRAAI